MMIGPWLTLLPMPVLEGGRLGCRAVATIISLAAVVVSLTIGIWHPGLGGRLVSEDHIVEWVQVVLAAAAGAVAFRQLRAIRRAGQPATLEVAIVAAMAIICIGEVDLDRMLFGTKVISTSFFVSPKYPSIARALAVLVVVGAPVGLGVWLLTHFRDLGRSGTDALRQPWGQSAGFGMALFLAVEVFERTLKHVPALPAYFAEEVLELVAMICIFIGLVARGLQIPAQIGAAGRGRP
jgi:hypothetical protein